TSLKSPMSGTEISVVVPMLTPRPAGSTRSDGHRVGLLRIQTVFADRLRSELGLDLSGFDQRSERCDRYVVAVHFEEAAQLRPGIGAAVAVGAEHLVYAVLGHERTDLLGEGLDVVGRGDDGARAPLQALGHVGNAGLGLGVQHV